MKQSFYCDCGELMPMKCIRNMGMDLLHKWEYQCVSCASKIYCHEDYEDDWIEEQRNEGVSNDEKCKIL